MPRGPLPDPNAIRRNRETIPTTTIPVSGNPELPPESPLDLGPSGRAWWEWAWATPQSTNWDEGSLYTVAHRAAMEDELAALEMFESGDLADVLGLDDEDEALKRVAAVIQRLKKIAGDGSKLRTHMQKLDLDLGLSPKGLAALRWKIVDEDGESAAAPAAPPVLRRVV